MNPGARPAGALSFFPEQPIAERAGHCLLNRLSDAAATAEGRASEAAGRRMLHFGCNPFSELTGIGPDLSS